ncbi:MAG: uroporphyrinogen decarboxylase family protein [Caldilineaceae bacterium]
MNSRERVQLSINHQEPDRVPLDLGGSLVTGMNVSMVYRLRQALGLDVPGTPVKVIEPYQMLGEIGNDLADALGVDVVGLRHPRTMFGFRNDSAWKPWTTFDGTPVLVPLGFNTDPEPGGDILMYPEGDKTVPPSGHMPKNGWYFDAIPRQGPVDYDNLDPADNTEEFEPISDADLEYFRVEADRLYSESDRAIFADFGGTGFGDIALVPAAWRRLPPKGIRAVEDWYMATAAEPDYVYAVFERQCEIALANLEKLYAAVGNRISIIFVTGTDFGTQRGPFISPAAYRKLYQPFHRQVNDWVHSHTTWKTFIHSCGSVMALIPDFLDAGFDIMNPVQCSAALMDPHELKRQFGERVTFWGGGVDTQHTLPNGAPDAVRAQVAERIRIFGPGGGYVFNTIHNVQPLTPIENLVAMYETVRECGRYPLN